MLLAHLVSGRYGAQSEEDRLRNVAPAKAGWFSRLIAFFSLKR